MEPRGLVREYPSLSTTRERAIVNRSEGEFVYRYARFPDATRQPTRIDTEP